MSLEGIPISDQQCIGASLPIINNAFLTLDSEITALSSSLADTNTEVTSLSSKLKSTSSQVDSLSTIVSNPPSPPNLNGDVISIGLTTTYSNVVPANKGGAGTNSGILKANGVGVVTPAVAGTDYVTPSFVSNTFIPKPSTASNQQVLTYSTSTSTWVASAAPSPTPSINGTSISSVTTSYTLQATDANAVIVMNNTNAVSITVPTFASVAFPKGTEIILIQRGGVATVSPASGVTIISGGNKYKSNGTNSGICLINLDTNLWFMGGDRAL